MGGLEKLGNKVQNPGKLGNKTKTLGNKVKTRGKNEEKS